MITRFVWFSYDLSIFWHY